MTVSATRRVVPFLVIGGVTALLIVPHAVAGIPLPAFDELRKARKCSADGGVVTCRYELDKTYRFGLVIDGVGSPTPTVEVQQIEPFVMYPRITYGDPCIEILSAFRDLVVYISVVDGTIHLKRDECSRVALKADAGAYNASGARDGGTASVTKCVANLAMTIAGCSDWPTRGSPPITPGE